MLRPTVTRLLLLLLAALALCPGRPARADWSWQFPPNLVTADSGKRNAIFYVGEPVTFALSGSAATRYEVRDYWGALVDQGPVATALDVSQAAVTTKIAVNVQTPGWYKLYLFGTASTPPWGASVGGTTFVIFRPDPHFPARPAPDVSGGPDSSTDEVVRDMTGMGPQRYAVQDAGQPGQAIAQLEAAIAIDRQLYLPFDPLRHRALLVAFPNGTQDLAGVRQIVSHFQSDVTYWEGRNEPNYTSAGAAFATGEEQSFYQTVKGVNPSLQVLGPAVVSIDPGTLPWVEDFLRAGGGKCVDGFSFHAYNNILGDTFMARKNLDALNALLAKYGVGSLPKWQTEQGYMAALYGAYEPRHQGAWTMLQMMIFEQYGIPKEHNHLWYDKSHGFWDVPTWWENDDGGLNPAAPLMRVWSEELYGTNFARSYDLGPTGNKLFLGSLFGGSGKQVAVFQSTGSTDGALTLQVNGGSGTVHVVSAFGAAQDLPVTGGAATLPVPELPVYVELQPGQTLMPSPVDWGPDLALAPGTTASSSGSPAHPLDPSINNDIGKIINGQQENAYYRQAKDDHPWMSNVGQFPAWVEVDLPAKQSVDHVVVYAAPPWQWDGSLLDYELQYDSGGGRWVTLEHVQEPPTVVNAYTPTTRTVADSFYSDRWVFLHQFTPVTTQKIRLLVHDVTWGGGASPAIVAAGGQTGAHQIVLREVEVYSGGGNAPATPGGPTVAGQVRYAPRPGFEGRMVGGRFQGSADGVSYTDLYTVTSAPAAGQWTAVPLAVDPATFRYLRYLSPDGDYGNIAELEFDSGGSGGVKVTGTPFGTPGSWGGQGNDLGKVFDGDLSSFFDAPAPGTGDYVGIDQGAVPPVVTPPVVTPPVVTPPVVTPPVVTPPVVTPPVVTPPVVTPPVVTPPVVTPPVVTPPVVIGTGTGLTGQYFAARDLTGTPLTRTDPTVSFDWSGGSPDPAIPPYNFSARWTGQVQAVSSGAYTFTTTSDDGVRLWVNGQLVVDDWTDHGPTDDSGTITLQAGQKYDLKMEYYQAGGGAVAKLSWAGPGLPRQIVPQSQLFPAIVAAPPTTGTGMGLTGTYFATMDLTGPVLTRTDPAVSFNWSGAPPDPTMSHDRYSVRWTGQVQPLYSETYTFTTRSDDGVRLWVNGQLLVDDWNDHATTVDTGTITLQAGQKYALKMEYYQDQYDAIAGLSWASPSQPAQIVPQSQLFP